MWSKIKKVKGTFYQEDPQWLSVLCKLSCTIIYSVQNCFYIIRYLIFSIKNVFVLEKMQVPTITKRQNIGTLKNWKSLLTAALSIISSEDDLWQKDLRVGSEMSRPYLPTVLGVSSKGVNTKWYILHVPNWFLRETPYRGLLQRVRVQWRNREKAIKRSWACFEFRYYQFDISGINTQIVDAKMAQHVDSK